MEKIKDSVLFIALFLCYYILANISVKYITLIAPGIHKPFISLVLLNLVFVLTCISYYKISVHLINKAKVPAKTRR